MSNFWLLIKTNFYVTFNINKILKRSKEGKLNVFFGILMALVAFLFYFIAFFYLLIFGDTFNRGGKPELILLFSMVIGFVFVLISTLTLSPSYLYKNKDFDLLMSLPLKPITIVSSKVAYMLILNYLVFSFIYIPSLIVFALYNNTSVLFWLMSVPTFFIIPMLPIAFSSIIAYLFGFVKVNFKVKNIISIVSFLVVILFFMYISFSAQALEENPANFTNMISEAMNKVFFIRFGYEGFFGNFLSYLLFLVIFVVPFVFFLFFISKNFLKANARSKNVYLNKNFKLVEQKSTHHLNALIGKEVKRYFGTSIYVVNTIVGPVLSLAGVFSLYFGLAKSQTPIPDELFKSGLFSLLITIMLVLTISLTSTTSCSFNIEGKQFWILKSSPIAPKEVFMAKAFVNLLITLPFIVIDVILSFFLFKVTLTDAFFMLAIPTLIAFYMSFLGLYINLLMPRLDMDSDMKAVKQSMSVLVTMLFGMISGAILFICGYLLIGFGKFAAFSGALVTSLLLFFISRTLLYNHGIKLYNKLSS